MNYLKKGLDAAKKMAGSATTKIMGKASSGSDKFLDEVLLAAHTPSISDKRTHNLTPHPPPTISTRQRWSS
jgi:hypothetical protein